MLKKIVDSFFFFLLCLEENETCFTFLFGRFNIYILNNRITFIGVIGIFNQLSFHL